jgi:hypothetical protein
MKLYPIFLKEIKKKYILKAQDPKSQNNYAQLNFGEKSIFIPLVIFIQQNIDYSIFNLLFIRIIIESVSSRTKNINALNCFFYINQELLDNIGVEGTQILAPRSIVNVVECLRFYSKNMRNLQYRYETGGEEIPMTFRINIERLSMPSIFLNIL